MDTWRGETVRSGISASVKARARGVIGSLGSPVGSTLLKRSLTVVCYHRVVESVEPGLFPEVVSTSPSMFDEHLDLMSEDHRFVTLDDVVAWLGGDSTLPPRPLLLTFDDGYRDNYETAFPILQRRGVPAAFFLATEHMDTGELLWWDLANLSIANATGTEVDLPLLGPTALPGPEGRAALARRWVAAAKLLPNSARLEALHALSSTAPVAEARRAGVAMTWDQAREMATAGMSFGGHTRSHPILSSMPPDDARSDIAEGMRRMEEELGGKVDTFAYPNGGRGDFDGNHKQALGDLGVVLAFSLLSGPASFDEVMADPLEVRRIYIGAGDDPERLRLKLLGLSRLSDKARRLKGAGRNREDPGGAD